MLLALQELEREELVEVAAIELDRRDAIPNRDFVVRYRLAGQRPQVALLAQHDAAPGGQGSRSLEYDPLYQLKRAVLTELGAPVVRDYQYANHWNLSRLDEAGRVFHYDDAAHPDRIAGLTVYLAMWLSPSCAAWYAAPPSCAGRLRA